MNNRTKTVALLALLVGLVTTSGTALASHDCPSGGVPVHNPFADCAEGPIAPGGVPKSEPPLWADPFTDSDGDGIPNAFDDCPFDNGKVPDADGLCPGEKNRQLTNEAAHVQVTQMSGSGDAHFYSAAGVKLGTLSRDELEADVEEWFRLPSAKAVEVGPPRIAENGTTIRDDDRKEVKGFKIEFKKATATQFQYEITWTNPEGTVIIERFNLTRGWRTN